MNQAQTFDKLRSGTGWNLQHSQTLGTTYIFHLDQAGRVDSTPERIAGHVFEGLLKHGKIVMYANEGTFEYYLAASDEQILEFDIRRMENKMVDLRHKWAEEKSYLENARNLAEQRGALAGMAAVDRRMDYAEYQLGEARRALEAYRKARVFHPQIGGAL